ncbi:hypothetical protein TWF281_002843 [Arthrobotrys megalospora]
MNRLEAVSKIPTSATHAEAHTLIQAGLNRPNSLDQKKPGAVVNSEPLPTDESKTGEVDLDGYSLEPGKEWDILTRSDSQSALAIWEASRIVKGMLGRMSIDFSGEIPFLDPSNCTRLKDAWEDITTKRERCASEGLVESGDYLHSEYKTMQSHLAQIDAWLGQASACLDPDRAMKCSTTILFRRERCRELLQYCYHEMNFLGSTFREYHLRISIVEIFEMKRREAGEKGPTVWHGLRERKKLKWNKADERPKATIRDGSIEAGASSGRDDDRNPISETALLQTEGKDKDSTLDSNLAPGPERPAQYNLTNFEDDSSPVVGKWATNRIKHYRYGQLEGGYMDLL